MASRLETVSMEDENSFAVGKEEEDEVKDPEKEALLSSAENPENVMSDSYYLIVEFCARRLWQIVAALSLLLLLTNAIVWPILFVVEKRDDINHECFRDRNRLARRLRLAKLIVLIVSGVFVFVVISLEPVVKNALDRILAQKTRETLKTEGRDMESQDEGGDAVDAVEEPMQFVIFKQLIMRHDLPDDGVVEGADSAIVQQPEAQEWTSVSYRKNCWSAGATLTLILGLLYLLAMIGILGIIFMSGVRVKHCWHRSGRIHRIKKLLSLVRTGLVIVVAAFASLGVVDAVVYLFMRKPMTISRNGLIIGHPSDSYRVGRNFSAQPLESPYPETLRFDGTFYGANTRVIPWKMLGGSNMEYYHDPLLGFSGSAVLYSVFPVVFVLLKRTTIARVFVLLAVASPVEKPRGVLSVLLLGPWREGALVLPRLLHHTVNAGELLLWYLFCLRRKLAPLTLLYIVSTLLPLSSPCYRGQGKAEGAARLRIELPSILAYVLVALISTLSYNIACIVQGIPLLVWTVLELVLSKRKIWQSADGYAAYYGRRPVLLTRNGGPMVCLPPTGRKNIGDE